jgi:hypothetical protein
VVGICGYRPWGRAPSPSSTCVPHLLLQGPYQTSHQPLVWHTIDL